MADRDYWRTQFYLAHSEFVKFNFSIPSYSVMAVYLRRSAHPTHARYDYVHVLDASKLTSAAGDGRTRRALQSQVSVYERTVEQCYWYRSATEWYRSATEWYRSAIEWYG